MHHLYLKGTMKEFVQTYGAACCGSLKKARDPCETTTPPTTPVPVLVEAGCGSGLSATWVLLLTANVVTGSWCDHLLTEARRKYTRWSMKILVRHFKQAAK